MPLQFRTHYFPHSHFLKNQRTLCFFSLILKVIIKKLNEFQTSNSQNGISASSSLKCAITSPLVKWSWPWPSRRAKHRIRLSAFRAVACGLARPLLQWRLLVPAVVPSAMNMPFNQWWMKMDLVQSAIVRPKSIGYF